jgi:hypothetical protein
MAETRFLERYLQGAYVEVWDELMRLGPAVRQEPVLSDARAVAAETMRRVRHNIMLIAERLRAIGYWFAEPDLVYSPPDSWHIESLRTFEAQVGPVPLSLAAWIEMVGLVNFCGRYPRLSYYHLADPTLMDAFFSGEIQPDTMQTILSRMGIPPGMPTLDDPQMQDMARQLNAMISSMGGLAQDFDPSLLNAAQAKHERDKAKAQTALPIAEADRVLSDPLFIHLDALDVEDYRGWQMVESVRGTPEPYRILIAPDELLKARYSGSATRWMALPDASADASLGETTFVEYLRDSLRWGGFPGLAEYEPRDQELVDYLTRDLLPI